jgi:hypothetical protein
MVIGEIEKRWGSVTTKKKKKSYEGILNRYSSF